MMWRQWRLCSGLSCGVASGYNVESVEIVECMEH